MLEILHVLIGPSHWTQIRSWPRPHQWSPMGPFSFDDGARRSCYQSLAKPFMRVFLQAVEPAARVSRSGGIRSNVKSDVGAPLVVALCGGNAERKPGDHKGRPA